MESALDIDEELELLELGAEKSHKNDNSFWGIYRPIQDDIAAKEKLVRTDPETAIRIFDIHKDEELGALFIINYRDNVKYNSAAYFISVDMGSPIKRLREPSDFWTYEKTAIESPVGKWVSAAIKNQNSSRKSSGVIDYKEE